MAEDRVWESIQQALRTEAGSPARVVDIGGGTGGLAVRLAGAGHVVTVIDPNPDALAALGRRADDAGVQVEAVQGYLAGLLDQVEPGSVDLVLCHGVLEVLDDPTAGLATIARALRPGGALSLLVAGRHAAVVARAMAGHLAGALEALTTDAPSGRAGRRFSAEEAHDLLTAAGFTPTETHGVSVFADLVPGALLDLEPGARAALADLERAVADRPEYLPLATRLHVLSTT